MDAPIEERGRGAVSQSIGAAIDSDDIPWRNPVA
jgi:hypothetical protein